LAEEFELQKLATATEQLQAVAATATAAVVAALEN
jgi:hypothetical protein